MSQVYLSNLQPDPKDPRDWIFEPEEAILPESHDLRDFTGFVEDQLSIGACAVNTGASGCEAYLISDGRLVDTSATDAFDLSRLFPYQPSRKALGLPDSIEGTTLREVMRVLKNIGICRESVWPYDVAKANEPPSAEAIADAANYKLHAYYRIPLTNTDKALYAVQYAIASGWPVAVGMRVGRMLPTLTPQEYYRFVHPTANPEIGGHAMLIVGYLRIKGVLYWIIENSWGPNWCDRGYFLCMATIAVIDGIDLWVMCGFAGIERVGRDLVEPKPVPAPAPVPPVEPAPEPVPEPVPPAPQPDPVPPAPEPTPEPPQPTPEPPIPPAPEPIPPTPEPVPPIPEEKSGGNGALIAGAIVLIFIIAYLGGHLN